MAAADEHPGARTRGWVVGRAAGAPVVVSPGWAVAAVVLTLLFAPTVRALAPTVGDSAYVVSASFVLLLLVSVFLHELAHALMARRCGIEVRELAVTLLGGHTRFASAAPTPGSSALVAVVGPAVNLVLGVAAWAVSQLLPAGGIAAVVVAAAAVANGFVALFNLVPGLPLDGGRVLEALVWHLTGRRGRGAEVAGWVGRLVAVGVVAWVLVRPLLAGARPSLTAVVWASLVGAFLWSGAAAAVHAGRTEQAVERITVRGLMTQAQGVPGHVSLGDAVGLLDAGTEVVLLGPDGRPVAYLDRYAVASVPRERAAQVPLTAVAVALPGGAVVDADLTGAAAVRAVGGAARTSPASVVVEPDGRVVGLLRAQDVIDALRTGRRA